MRSLATHGWEPSYKRQKLDLSSNNYALPDVSKYIAAGCLRIARIDCTISTEIWRSCSDWSKFMHPKDYYNLNPPYLDNVIQEKLLHSPIISPYQRLHQDSWIRMEFKSLDQDMGQVRVYILADDVERGTINRQYKPQRKAIELLLGQIDTSKAIWEGEWSKRTPVAHVDPTLDGKDEDDVTLFYLFNTLPSPTPNPERVSDQYARDAMYGLLDSDVEGLTTTLHRYQRRTAAMMLEREAQPAQVIDPRIRPMVDQNGNNWYCDLNTSMCLKEPRKYETARGGICAETMGLGKTLICLALILATKELSSQIPIEHSLGIVPIRKTTGSLMEMAAANIGRNGTPWQGFFKRIEADGSDFVRCKEAIQKNVGFYLLPPPTPRRNSRMSVYPQPRKIWLTTATLVVVPPNLVKQWQEEIKKHTFGLKVLVMNNGMWKSPLPPAEELAQFDIILFSKRRFDQEATDENDYHSPLKDLHFKRLITDEGHGFGNASTSSQTNAGIVVEFLQLTSRWIISGTPTQGLYGAEVSRSSSEESSGDSSPLQFDLKEGPGRNLTSGFTKPFAALRVVDSDLETTKDLLKPPSYKDEREDIKKLGNIATVYLKARPWANTSSDGDIAKWSDYVLQPRHGSTSRGNMDCLRSTLESMIIRHRPEDVEKDIVLPALEQNFIYLDGSMQDKLSLNMFSMMIVSNAVTSERKDQDYLFHPRQRKALNQLVANLRQSSFHWSGFTLKDIQITIDIANKFLENETVMVSTEDEALLREAIRVGEIVLENIINKSVIEWHEMPMFIQNELPEDVRAAWSLGCQGSRSPTLMGTSMVYAAQKFVATQLWKQDPMEGLVEAGQETMKASSLTANPPGKPTRNKVENSKTKTPALTGFSASQIYVASTSKARNRAEINQRALEDEPSTNMHIPVPVAGNDDISFERQFSKKRTIKIVGGNKFVSTSPFLVPSSSSQTIPKKEDHTGKLTIKSAMKKSFHTMRNIDKDSPLMSASIVSTGSAKLSYLIDRITQHQQTEKIIVFYEADNVAYYIAQALEVLQIKHLIYAKTLHSARKAQYVVTFNQREDFRVLLMDISQAAFGLDMSAASRVFFVNPVFSPQIEAQAVKRAHRIGQTKPVFVETLVLKGSIEEAILDRRNNMTNEEHNKCKNNLLEDQEMFDWIRNVKFLPISDGIPEPEQMAPLKIPQPVFNRVGFGSGDSHNDSELIHDGFSPKGKARGKGETRPTPFQSFGFNRLSGPSRFLGRDKPVAKQVASAEANDDDDDDGLDYGEEDDAPAQGSEWHSLKQSATTQQGVSSANNPLSQLLAPVRPPTKRVKFW